MTTTSLSEGSVDFGYGTLSEADKAALESRYLEGFQYRPITAEKRTLVQRETATPQGTPTPSRPAPTIQLLWPGLRFVLYRVASERRCKRARARLVQATRWWPPSRSV